MWSGRREFNPKCSPTCKMVLGLSLRWGRCVMVDIHTGIVNLGRERVRRVTASCTRLISRSSPRIETTVLCLVAVEFARGIHGCDLSRNFLKGHSCISVNTWRPHTNPKLPSGPEPTQIDKTGLKKKSCCGSGRCGVLTTCIAVVKITHQAISRAGVQLLEIPPVDSAILPSGHHVPTNSSPCDDENLLRTSVCVALERCFLNN